MREAVVERGSGAAARAREIVAGLVGAFGRNDLLTRASALAYQALFAMVPTALVGVALLGFLDLRDVWSDDLAPRVRREVSPEGFAVIDSSVDRILQTRQIFWVTGGLALAVYQVSGAVRGAMGALNDIYEVDERRPFLRRIVLSVALAVAVFLGLGLAVVGVLTGGEIARAALDGAPAAVLGAVLAWALPVALVLGVLGLLARVGTAEPPPIRWIGAASAATVGAWLLATVAFRWYATEIAAYSSIFGGLASAIVLMTYLYISAIVFLGGYQLDALLRRRREGPLDG